MSDTSPVSLVCWDVLGAAAADENVLERAFAEAIATQGVVTGTGAYVRSMVQFDRMRGRPPADVMQVLFPEDEIRAQAANLAFERSFQAAVDRFGMLPLPGANDALAKLTAAGIKVCLVSSLSRPALALTVAHLDWWERADLVLCADDVATLYDAIKTTLTEAVERSAGLAAADLKGEKKSGLRVHGRTGQACPVCGDTVREVSFADSALQYCPTCQTGGKPLADRRLSRLLK
jgi:hypothetical protein